MKINVPEVIETAHDLDEVTLDFSRAFLGYVDGQMGADAKRKMGIFRNVELLKVELLEKTVKALPREYVRIQHFSGISRFVASGEYEILKPIPRDVYLSSIRKAGMIL